MRTNKHIFLIIALGLAFSAAGCTVTLTEQGQVSITASRVEQA